MRFSVAAFLSLFLAAAAESPVSASDGGELETGVRVDPAQLLAQGWRSSADPDDFPLGNEGKSRRLLAGFHDPQTGARIFILYTLPASSLPLDAIDNEPSDALLAHLGASRAGASGRFEVGFLGPGLDAIHWTIRSSGDGVTFLPTASSRRVETFGLRTILSFGVVGPGLEVRRVVLSAFLRCESAHAERLTPVFFDLLRTLRPARSGARIVPEGEIPEGGTGTDLAHLFSAMSRLVERRSAEAGGPGAGLSREEEETVEAFLRVDPGDYLANRLLLRSRPHFEPDGLEEAAREAYLAYLENALETAETLPDPGGLRAFYLERLEALTGRRRARPPEPCTAGERWADPATGRRHACTRFVIGEPGAPALVWLPEHSRPEEVVSAGGRSYRWESGFETWLPAEVGAGTVVDVGAAAGESRSFVVLDRSTAGGSWALLRDLSGAELWKRGPDAPSPCPEGTQPVGVTELDLASLRDVSFFDALAGRGSEALVLGGSGRPVLVRLPDPELVPLETKRQVRRWRRARLAALCLAR